MIVEILTFTPSIPLKPNAKAAIPPPIPIRPFTIPEKDKPDIFFIALANISIALAIIIKEMPALIIPLPENRSRVFDIDLKEIVSMPNIRPIANKDLVIFTAFI